MYGFTREQIEEIRRRLYYEGKKDTDFPLAHEVDGSETIAIVQDSVNRKIPLSLIFNSPAFESYYKLLIDTITEKQNELNSIIDEIRERKIGLSNSFGDGETVGINQKVLTQAINKIWQKIENMNGEQLSGIKMVVTPDYFISENGADITIRANTVEANGIFETIKFYANDVLIAEAENVDTFEGNYHIDNPTVIKCVAKILGIEYTEQKYIEKYNELFIGAGTDYNDIINQEHSFKLNNGLRTTRDITCNDNDHIYIVVGKNLSGYIRMDMNGFEIPATKIEVNINGTDYDVYTSVNTYLAGTYNIDING